MLAVDEACTNIIKHAYEFSPAHDIDIEIVSTDRKLEVIITHTGKSFDPQTVKPPNMREYLRKYQRGGLGMHLMRSLMDEVDYKSYPDRRSEVHLVKFLPVNVQTRR